MVSAGDELPRRASFRNVSAGEEYWRKVVGRADCPEHIHGKTIFDLEYLFILLSELNETSKLT